MPKPLREYTLSDWARLRPILHSIKALRYRLIDRAYCRQSPPDGTLESLISLCRDRQVIVSIAFNDNELILAQAKRVRDFIPHATYLIADNSSNADAASAIERHCRTYGLPYIRLPKNPWQGRSAASRSHGQAMNWVWQQILRPARPSSFGFIDHDLIPTNACDPFQKLQTLPFYGDKRWAKDRWFLWAGYCFFRFAEAEETGLDFSQDWFIGLDTGGANWRRIYSKWDPALLPDRKIREASILPNVELRQAYIEWRDDWVHEVGLAGDRALRAQKRKAFLELIDTLSKSHQAA